MNRPCGVVAFGRLLAVTLVLCASARAQLREDVSFQLNPGPLGSGRSVYVLGDLEELGGSDLVRSVKLADTGSGWEVRVSLPVNTSYAYRFYDRAHDPLQVGNPNNGTPLGPVQNGSTAVVPLAPTAKRMLYHTSFAGPLLFWRQGGGAFASVPMVRVGAGRTAGESRYEVAAFAAARGDVELYVTDASQAQRDPAVGTYATPLDAFFLQDGHLFTYVPASSVGAQRRDYNPASPPFVTSAILNENRGYRVVLPRGYDQHTTRRYPVLYAHDGPLWFDDATLPVDRDAARLAELTRLGEAGEMIVVCIDHAITLDPRVFFENRLRDFIPPGDFGLTPWGPVAGMADRYVAFIQTELKPVIDAQYRTKPDRDHTWTMGFSAGGVVTLYMGWDFSATFSRLASFAGQLVPPATASALLRSAGIPHVIYTTFSDGTDGGGKRRYRIWS